MKPVSLSVRIHDVNVLLHFWAQLPSTSMTRHPLPAARNSEPSLLPSLSGRFRMTFLSTAVVLVIGAIGSGAHALTLGRLNVQSGLGEPLRAEIDVAEATAEELAGLKINIASSDAFRAAGVPYNTVL